MFARNGLERFGGERQIHRVAGLGLEVDREAAKDRVDGGNFPETPASVKTIAALGKHQESIEVMTVQLTGGH